MRNYYLRLMKLMEHFLLQKKIKLITWHSPQHNIQSNYVRAFLQFIMNSKKLNLVENNNNFLR